MQNQKFSETLAGWVGTSEVERGTRLGILAGGVALILLFGAATFAQNTSTTVDFSQGQYAGLLIRLVSGFVVLVFALILAYYAGLSAPEVKTGESSRAGMLAGALTMLLFWVGQTIFALVDSARTPEGLQLDGFLRSRLIAGLGFFVVGGLFGWWGYRSAARRARSILTPPGSASSLIRASGELSLPETRQSSASTSHALESAPVAAASVESPPRPAEQVSPAASLEQPTSADGRQSTSSEEQSS